MNILYILLGIAAAIAFIVYSTYNSLVILRNQYKNAFSQIDVQLKRRYDLIPNLVEIAKKYMAHEKGTLEAVIQARNSAFNASNAAAQDPSDPEAMKKLAEAEKSLNSGLGRLMAIAEDYPDLKANESMASLNEELVSTENKVSFARQSFNDSVTAYNNKRETFPSNLIAGFFSFKEAELFEIEAEEQRENVKVSFD